MLLARSCMHRTVSFTGLELAQMHQNHDWGCPNNFPVILFPAWAWTQMFLASDDFFNASQYITMLWTSTVVGWFTVCVQMYIQLYAYLPYKRHILLFIAVWQDHRRPPRNACSSTKQGWAAPNKLRRVWSHDLVSLNQGAEAPQPWHRKLWKLKRSRNVS